VCFSSRAHYSQSAPTTLHFSNLRSRTCTPFCRSMQCKQLHSDALQYGGSNNDRGVTQQIASSLAYEAADIYTDLECRVLGAAARVRKSEAIIIRSVTLIVPRSSYRFADFFLACFSRRSRSFCSRTRSFLWFSMADLKALIYFFNRSRC